MTDGYRALRETAAYIDLSSRGRIKVTGDDRARLLHAMCTNNVKDLVPGAGCYAFFLNAQGRILADANILCFEDHFLLDTEAESRVFLIEHLDKFIIADDVVLEDITSATACLGLEGPNVDSGLPAPLSHRTVDGITTVRASSTGATGLRRIEPLGGAITNDKPLATPDEAKTVRLDHFFPRYSEDITTANLPQETGITDALHFSKGCYLGQEIVERVRSRGHVNRLLVGLTVHGTEPLPRGAKVVFDGSEVGEITSSAYSPANHRWAAMAYVRIAAAKPGTRVVISEREAQVEPIKSSRT